MIDVPSDTLTLPTPAIHQAMFEAQLDDGGFGEDPTLVQLEALAAMIVGKLVPRILSKRCK